MEKFIPYSTILAAVIVATQCIVWKDCGSKESSVKSLSVSGCEKDKVCNLVKGQNYTISVDFTGKEDITKAVAVVHGVLSGIPVPFPINNPDGCKDSGLTCPVKAGTEAKYHSQIFVKTEYPKLKVVVKWELRDQNSQDIFCVMLPAQIVDGKKGLKMADNTLRYKPSK